MFELAWPWVFALLPLPWLARLLLPAADSGEPVLKVGFLDELEGLAGRRARLNLPTWRQQAPYVLIWLLLLCAAARPQWLGEPVPVSASGRDLLVAVDVSGSMDFPDMQWKDEDISRLDLVKALLGDFLQDREGDRVGLILFGSQAYLQAPLTFDRRTVRTFLDEAQIGIAGKNTAIGDAIGLAVKRLRERPAQSRVLVLITDGANNGGQIHPLTAARLAAQEGVRIYTIGIGANPEASGTLACWASTRAWTWTKPRSRRLPTLPMAPTSAPTTVPNWTPSAIPSTNWSRWPSNRPRPAQPKICTPGRWPLHCC
ncbi:hypothetical protein PspTeo4_03056 [Pseudomonas sp. Teo4]|nr:hypothetical protein [Pseudomonas sp. Teo4]